MLKRLLKNLHKNQKGITGLETAIILIAFVVVAAVFAYTVLSAGIFSSQKGKEAIYSGLEETRATIEPRGSMLGYTGSVGGTDTAVKLSFTVSNALAGQAVDLTPPYTVNGTTGAIESSGLDNVCLLSFIDANELISDAAWTVEFVGKDSGDYLLESEEKAVVTVWLVNYNGTVYSLGSGASDPWIDAAGNLLGIYDKFTIEMRPEQGAVLSMGRTLPGRLDPVMDLT
jgi:flagellin FlaB